LTKLGQAILGAVWIGLGIDFYLYARDYAFYYHKSFVSK